MANKDQKKSKKINFINTASQKSPKELSNYADGDNIDYQTALNLVTEQNQANGRQGGGFGNLDAKIDLFYFEAFNKLEVDLLQWKKPNDLQSVRDIIKLKTKKELKVECLAYPIFTVRSSKNIKRDDANRSEISGMISSRINEHPQAISRLMDTKEGSENQIKDSKQLGIKKVPRKKLAV